MSVPEGQPILARIVKNKEADTVYERDEENFTKYQAM